MGCQDLAEEVPGRTRREHPASPDLRSFVKGVTGRSSSKSYSVKDETSSESSVLWEYRCLDESVTNCLCYFQMTLWQLSNWIIKLWVKPVGVHVPSKLGTKGNCQFISDNITYKFNSSHIIVRV